MSRLAICPVEKLDSSTLAALEAVKVAGKVSEVYLQFANSEPALRAYLNMESSLSESSLSTLELEAIKLWVSEQTGCEFCLSVHSYKATQAGLNSDQQIAVRSSKPSGNERIDALLIIASSVLNCRGSVPGSVLQKARDAGLDDENLVDLTMAIATIFFTNITNHINDTKSSLPAAPPLG